MQWKKRWLQSSRGQGLAKVRFSRRLSLYLLWKFPEFSPKKHSFLLIPAIFKPRFFFCCCTPCVETASANDVLALDSLERQGTKNTFLEEFWVGFFLRTDNHPHVLSSARRWQFTGVFLGGTAGQKKKLTQGDRTRSWILLKVKGFLFLPFTFHLQWKCQVCVCVYCLWICCCFVHFPNLKSLNKTHLTPSKYPEKSMFLTFLAFFQTDLSLFPVAL